MTKSIFCCQTEAVWVDNVPSKPYYYCKTCKKEVLAPLLIEETDKTDINPYDNVTHWDYSVIYVTNLK